MSIDSPAPPRQVFLFSGHMLDAPGRAEPRFPPDKEAIAAQAIIQLLEAEGGDAQDLAVCGAACGGDLLFAEACLAHGLRLELYIPFDVPAFLQASVAFAGAGWTARFHAAVARAELHVMPDERGPLPEDADPFELNNLWMLEAASRFGPERVEAVLLWNGQGGDGPGGTQHLMQAVEAHAGRTHWIDTRTLWT